MMMRRYSINSFITEFLYNRDLCHEELNETTTKPMYDVKCLAKHLRTTIAEISYLLISFKITYVVIKLHMADMVS